MAAALTANMIKALTGATFSETRKGLAYNDADAIHTGWTMHGVNGNTLRAMVKRGLCMGDGGLTESGVSAMAAQNGMGALTTPAPVVESPTDTTDAHTDTQSVSGGTVTVQGADGFDMTPDMSALTGECFYGCGRPVTGMFCDMYGATQGVCDLDRSKLGDHITVVPVDPAIWDGKGEGTAVVGIVQNAAGNSGLTHYHTPGCRDVVREMKRFGQNTNDAIEGEFSSVAAILEFEYGDISSNEFESGTPGYYADILHNAQIDKSLGADGFGVKIMPCLSIPAGRMGDSPLVVAGDFYRLGFDQPSAERKAEINAEIDAHECDESDCITCLVRNMNREDAAQSEGPWIDPECGCERHANPSEVPCPDHAGSMVTREYLLSVTVDELTGASVNLGWVMLTMPSAFADSPEHVAAVYGAVHGEGNPRHGWSSIITVHDSCELS